jgi:hypothetical protein
MSGLQLSTSYKKACTLGFLRGSADNTRKVLAQLVDGCKHDVLSLIREDAIEMSM